MFKAGIWIETGENGVKEANFGVITAARGHGDAEIHAFVLDGNADAYQDALQSYGVQKVVSLGTDGGDLSSKPDLQAAALAEAANHFEITAFLGLSSARGRDLLARVAALMGAPLVQDCIGIDLSSQTVSKSHFSGKTVATVKINANPFVCSVRPNAIEAQTAPCQCEPIEYRASVQDPGKLAVKEIKKSQTGAVDLTEANIIITGGYPIGAAENYNLLQQCADVLGAAVGASRAAVDAGYAPHSMQIGQTGKTVSPKLYIGCGLSGSVQHFAGMKTSKVIVAINTDAEAPIFEKCDYGIIGDLFEVVPVLTQVLREQKG